MNGFFCRALRLATIAATVMIPAPGSGAEAQTSKSPPENADWVRYGAGWECRRGYQRQGDACLEVRLPDHAFLTNTIYGKGWECSYGFVENGDRCAAVQVPANASLDLYFGNSWKCLSGYRKSDTGCDLIKVPNHAFLSETANGADGTANEAIGQRRRRASKSMFLPMRFLIDKGDEWRCERGFEMKDDVCSIVHVPDHAAYLLNHLE